MELGNIGRHLTLPKTLRFVPLLMSHLRNAAPAKNVVEKVVLTFLALIPIDFGRKCHLDGNIPSGVSVESAIQLYSDTRVDLFVFFFEKG